MQEEMTCVQTIVELLPQQYTHTMNLHHEVEISDNPVCRTMLSDDEIKAFVEKFDSEYGDDVTVQVVPKSDHKNVKMFYAKERFRSDNGTFEELKNAMYYQLLHGNTKSHMTVRTTYC